MYQNHYNNLCELYINSGEGYLSRTCQTHPRLINQYKEDILERNLQLTCPVVAKYLVKKAVGKFNNKEFEDVAYFEPFYLKEFQGVKKKKSE